jgi:hypothetical protein
MTDEDSRTSAEALGRVDGRPERLKLRGGVGRRVRVAMIAAGLSALAAVSLVVSPAFAFDVPTHADVQRALERIVQGARRGSPQRSKVLTAPSVSPPGRPTFGAMCLSRRAIVSESAA